MTILSPWLVVNLLLLKQRSDLINMHSYLLVVSAIGKYYINFQMFPLAEKKRKIRDVFLMKHQQFVYVSAS